MINQKLYEARNDQEARLNERRSATTFSRELLGKAIEIHPGVYDCGPDTELIGSLAHKYEGKRFLEIGCGTGLISLVFAEKFETGIACDINPRAVANCHSNILLNGISNVKAVESDLFLNVHGEFDMIIFNPPYCGYDAKDYVDSMFWDSGDESKKLFFREVCHHLAKGGKVIFGWADFGDLDYALPWRCAAEVGLHETGSWSRRHRNGKKFIAVEFTRW